MKTTRLSCRILIQVFHNLLIRKNDNVMRRKTKHKNERKVVYSILYTDFLENYLFILVNAYNDENQAPNDEIQDIERVKLAYETAGRIEINFIVQSNEFFFV